MESLQYVVCVACYRELGPGAGAEEDRVLRCAACRLWQHWKCTKGVPASFYAQFYLSVTLGEKPAQWLCHYCTKVKQEIPLDIVSPAMPPKKNPALRIPSNPPPSANEDSEDELHMTFDIARTGREGLELHTESQESSPEDDTCCQVLIRARPIFLDAAPLPVTYSLVQEPSGRKVIKDGNGNTFFTTRHIKDEAESYQCAQDSCRFMVRASETIGEFLLDGSTDFHNHHSPSESDVDVETIDTADTSLPSLGGDLDTADTADSDTSLPSLIGDVYTVDTADTVDSDCSLPSLTATPFNTPAKPIHPTRQQSSPQKGRDVWYHGISPILPTLPTKIIQTPLQTPAIRATTIQTPLQTPVTNGVRPRVGGSEASFCSNTTDGNSTAHLEITPAIHRFQPLTTPRTNKYVKSGADFSFSSSGSSSDDLNITRICDLLSDHDNDDSHADLDPAVSHGNQGSNNGVQTEGNTEKTTEHLDVQPPSPTDTIPYCDSSDSEDEESQTTTRKQPQISYSVQEGTASGARSRLTDSLRYTYQIKFKLGARVFWICTERGTRCPGTVIQQRRNHFTRGTAFHNHQPGHLQPCLDTSSTSQTPVSQSQTTSPACHSQPPVSQSETTSSTSQPPASQSETSDAGMMLKKQSTTRHQSKVARIVKPTATAAETSATPATPAPSSEPGEESGPVSLQEIATCGQPRFTAKSALIDHRGFLYRKKTEDPVKYETVWKCTSRGPQGPCRGKVTVNYISDFNRDDSQYFCWTMNHSDAVDNVTFSFEPHNHESDWTAALMFKLKTLVHMLVFYDGFCGVKAEYLVKDAWKKLEPEERARLPVYENDASLKRYVPKVMKEYAVTEAKKGLHRYNRYNM